MLGVVALVDDPGVVALLAVVTGLAVAAVAFHPQIGRAFVQGSAYGDEARFPLRARPVGARSPPVLLGRAAASAAGGPLLLAARQWAVGTVVSAIAWACSSSSPGASTC